MTVRNRSIRMPLLIHGKVKEKVVSQVVLSVALGILFLNPYTEGAEYSNAILFMFSHYALFLIGFALSYRITSLHPLSAIPGAAIAVAWHLPLPFALSGSLLPYRLLEESTLVLSGWLTGSSIHLMHSLSKSVLLALWFCADTVLSVIFILQPFLYSDRGISQSPYSSSQFVILGVAMVFFMNAVIAYVVFRYVSKFRPVMLSEEP